MSVIYYTQEGKVDRAAKYREQAEKVRPSPVPSEDPAYIQVHEKIDIRSKQGACDVELEVDDGWPLTTLDYLYGRLRREGFSCSWLKKGPARTFAMRTVKTGLRIEW